MRVLLSLFLLILRGSALAFVSPTPTAPRAASLPTPPGQLRCQQPLRQRCNLLYSTRHGKDDQLVPDDWMDCVRRVVGTTALVVLLQFFGAGPGLAKLDGGDEHVFREPAVTVRMTSTTAPTSSRPSARRYWDIMNDDGGSAPLKKERLEANEQLVEYAVGTVNTMYYDASGGFLFQPPDFYRSWRELRDAARKHKGNVVLTNAGKRPTSPAVHVDLSTRQGAVATAKHVVSKLNDPFSKYLTREELLQELSLDGNDGFLGLGAVVEVPKATKQRPLLTTTAAATTASRSTNSKNWLSVTRAANLPMVTAVAPDSPAERAGFTVGDRIVRVGDGDSFVGETRESIQKILNRKYHAENYAGYPTVTLAKPVLGTATSTTRDNIGRRTLVFTGYRTSRLHLPTMSLGRPYVPRGPVRGDAIVHYEMLNKQDSIYLSSSHLSSTPLVSSTDNTDDDKDAKVGYIRLTRFSRSATDGFVRALAELEQEGAQSYIVDLRNNYGGVIQEAMLTASSLLRDPHAVLCFTMNARGGFTPHDVEEYVLDTRYPGYLLSQKESKTATLAQVKREDPEFFFGQASSSTAASSWTPPSSFASLHEQTQKRGITVGSSSSSSAAAAATQHSQKPLVLLINEGTASSAEVFASALHDNHRLVALVGSPTYGKGLIQHTFPMPDGGGLRLTVAEYLTPALHHVRPLTPIQPDVYCGKVRGQGIASNNIGADMCVGVALDALNNNDIVNNSDNI